LNRQIWAPRLASSCEVTSFNRWFPSLKIQSAVSRIIWTKGRYARYPHARVGLVKLPGQLRARRERERERERDGSILATKLRFKFMMKTDPRVKMLNLIRVSIKMNNNERARVSRFSLALRNCARLLRDAPCRGVCFNLGRDSSSLLHCCIVLSVFALPARNFNTTRSARSGAREL